MSSFNELDNAFDRLLNGENRHARVTNRLGETPPQPLTQALTETQRHPIHQLWRMRETMRRVIWSAALEGALTSFLQIAVDPREREAAEAMVTYLRTKDGNLRKRITRRETRQMAQHYKDLEPAPRKRRDTKLEGYIKRLGVAAQPESIRAIFAAGLNEPKQLTTAPPHEVQLMTGLELREVRRLQEVVR